MCFAGRVPCRLRDAVRVSWSSWGDSRGLDWAGEGGTQRAWVGVAGQQAVSSPVPAGCLPGGVLPHGHLPRDTCGAPAAALDARQLALLGLAASLPLLPLCRQHGQQRLLPDARQLRPRLLRG